MSSSAREYMYSHTINHDCLNGSANVIISHTIMINIIGASMSEPHIDV